MKIMGLCWRYTCSTAMCLTAFTWFKKHQKCLGSLRALCSAWWLKGCESCVISKYIIFPSCFLQSKLDFSPEFVQVTYRTLKGFFFFFFKCLSSIWTERWKGQHWRWGWWSPVAMKGGAEAWFRSLEADKLCNSTSNVFVKLQFVRGLGHIVPHSLSVIPSMEWMQQEPLPGKCSKKIGNLFRILTSLCILFQKWQLSLVFSPFLMCISAAWVQLCL